MCVCVCVYAFIASNDDLYVNLMWIMKSIYNYD
jgi:hypothetical protein